MFIRDFRCVSLRFCLPRLLLRKKGFEILPLPATSSSHLRMQQIQNGNISPAIRPKKCIKSTSEVYSFFARESGWDLHTRTHVHIHIHTHTHTHTDTRTYTHPVFCFIHAHIDNFGEFAVLYLVPVLGNQERQFLAVNLSNRCCFFHSPCKTFLLKCRHLSIQKYLTKYKHTQNSFVFQ